MAQKRIIGLLVLILMSCSSDNDSSITIPVEDDPNNPDNEIFYIPVVVHVIHIGEPIGEGSNLSAERILQQIESLNDDYRRRVGTLGYNEHPDGSDTKIEFVFAKQDMNGAPTNGIVRVNSLKVENPVPPNETFDHYAHYSYWDPSQYLNVWTVPYLELTDLFLGLGTGPETDLEGRDSFLKGEPIQSEGVIINASHFGKSNSSSVYNLGRTLTHEIGHYLGLLHPWGTKDCEMNDYCDDTPPVSEPVSSCTAALGCDGEEIQYENYMNWTPDACMNLFTKDQTYRMRYVLENSPRRNTLLISKGLQAPK